MSLSEQLQQQFPGLIEQEETATGEPLFRVPRNQIIEVCTFLRDSSSPSFDFLMDLFGVDCLNLGVPYRFAVHYNLYSSQAAQRIHLKIPVPFADPIVPSLTQVWPAANWFEREVWDMFGIRFKKHPDLRRILMYDEFKGHPLRKDYPYNRRQPLVDDSYTDREIQRYVAAQEQVQMPSDEQQPAATGNTALLEDVQREVAAEDLTETSFLLNMGPSHPAMHGVIHLKLKLDGETIEDVDVGIGYLHRAFEKESEVSKWNQVFPYTDRLNYVSPVINNVGYALAVEKLLGIEITERAKFLRVIMSEISRIGDHLTCLGANAMELGAFTAFLYFIEAREALWELVEEITGARLTVSWVRVGGVKADLTADFPQHCRAALKTVREKIAEFDKLLSRNRIFHDRMVGTGVISREKAIAYGFTGPVLRSTGVDYDVRKANPYLVYDRFDFDIPYGEKGDNYDRYLCRLEEMLQSCRIIEQALEKLPGGALNVDHEGKEMPDDILLPGSAMADRGKTGHTSAILQIQALSDPTLSGGNGPWHEKIYPDEKRVVLPEKEKTYGSIEGVMNHFMLIMDGHGIRPPAGEAYSAVEGGNGELGFYVISDGTDQPYRVRVRPPCFSLMSGFHEMIRGDQIADLIATFGTINMIAGELDR